MAWYNSIGQESDTVISSRIRLARNLADYPFVSHLSDKDAKTVINRIAESLDGQGFSRLDFSDIAPVEAASYVEKHYVSREFAAKKEPHALLLNEDKQVSLMLCEEDHIRLQCLMPGLALEEAFRVACEYEDILDEHLSLAYDDTLGYLTHCPTNLGTGMRASVMMFLPALTLSGRINALSAELAKIGLTIRGLYGEGSESKGSLYQISNQVTLGITEEDTLKKLRDIISQIRDRERALRTSFKGESYERLCDRILRAEGILKYAHMLSSEEVTSLYSDIRLGIALGIVTDIDFATLGTLWIESLPATLTLAAASAPKTGAERDRARAAYIQGVLSHAASHEKEGS